ncbi:hypothetical protein S140_129 [Shewanella sp. phage 1/40]|uniref:hypothetical protein n=1 Tax=Shewanella phage 1/4 TaxID=1458859 RepID=UPI0004F79124|nr:hypothetical protein S14_134 [Shewanella sp. phage 1/4]YP_009104127.1 hypothetical protein S140_129 [Shewanella sp. phage 1/40]AHK11243.1 hypothetical protein S14_134 [Shewanella sp. phage 1/4]AHK11536.1 hypothetical protein S140_129 [Shewanella sp. phage 1/40]
MTVTTYDAKDIRVLREDEVDKFPWRMIEVLAEKYIHPVEAVRRGLEVCYLTGVDISYFEDRYLKRDKSVPENETFTLAYVEVLRDERTKSWIVR